MSQGFDNGKDDSQDNKKAIRKIVKEYKKIKKYQKSPLCEVKKLSGDQTYVDKLLKDYGVDPETLK